MSDSYNTFYSNQVHVTSKKIPPYALKAPPLGARGHMPPFDPSLPPPLRSCITLVRRYLSLRSCLRSCGQVLGTPPISAFIQQWQHVIRTLRCYINYNSVTATTDNTAYKKNYILKHVFPTFQFPLPQRSLLDTQNLQEIRKVSKYGSSQSLKEIFDFFWFDK